MAKSIGERGEGSSERRSLVQVLEPFIGLSDEIESDRGFKCLLKGPLHSSPSTPNLDAALLLHPVTGLPSKSLSSVSRGIVSNCSYCGSRDGRRPPLVNCELLLVVEKGLPVSIFVTFTGVGGEAGIERMPCLNVLLRNSSLS